MLAKTFERMKDKTAHNAPFCEGEVIKGEAGSGRGKKGVASKVAEATGLSKRRAQVKMLAKTFERMEGVTSCNRTLLPSKRGRKGEGRPKGIHSKVAEATGLSKSRVQQILAEAKPKPAKGKTFERMEGQVGGNRPPVSKLNDGRGKRASTSFQPSDTFP